MRKAIAVLLILFLMTSLFGCATSQGTGAVAGGAVGAGVGAAVSKHNPLLGALLGGALGALTGAMIGKYIDEQKKDRQQSIREISYRSGQGKIVRIDNANVAPGTVKAGETIGLSTSYYVISPDPGGTVSICETRIIKYNEQQIMEPIVRYVVRRQGETTSTAKIPIPRDAQSGNYEVITIIDNGTNRDQSVSQFYVQNM